MFPWCSLTKFADWTNIPPDPQQGSYTLPLNGSIISTNNSTTGAENTSSTGNDGTTLPPAANTDGENTEETQTDNVLKIQVTGSYINVSDFIFEVENDKDLKFKLDNISIEYVSGRTIKATFDVKNTIILK